MYLSFGKQTAEIMDLFRKINQEQKITILQVTHSEDCANYGNRTIVLDSGKVVAEKALSGV